MTDDDMYDDPLEDTGRDEEEGFGADDDMF